MKNILLIAFVLIICSNLYGQNIDDYFPTKNGTLWLWDDGSEQMYDGLLVGGRSFDEKYGMDLFMGITTNSLFGNKEGRIIYAINKDGVYEVIRIAIANGNRRQYDKPFYKILGLPGDNWEFIDTDGVIYKFIAYKGFINYDGHEYDDCIVVERSHLSTSGKMKITFKYYYAKNIGLVYVTNNNGPDTKEQIFQRLKVFQLGK